MPATEGSGNPVRTEDETILALDLLYRFGRPVGKEHLEVLNLSRLLRAATIYPLHGRKENFRNSDGALKLQNPFSAVGDFHSIRPTRGQWKHTRSLYILTVIGSKHLFMFCRGSKIWKF